MRVIQKKISLEDVTSRLPGVVPAYRERDGKTYKFDDASLKSREYVFPSNYGMIPRSVVIPDDITIVGAEKVCCNKLPCEEDEKVIMLSWETISNLYHFFTDYYHLLNDWGHCGLKYESAEAYYEHESKNGYADQMVYGTSKGTYLELDKLFEERGGKTMYEYISDTLIPSVEIPDEYENYWHTTRLYYPDIVKWNGWFKKRSSYTTKENCKNVKDCCDCAEYFDRGGSVMAGILDSAYKSIQDKINSIETCDPYIETDISLLVSIDDLGEFSILSNEYELGVDYRVAKGYGVDENTEGGTVVAISGQAMTLKYGFQGFDFNKEYMEKVYNSDQWEQHKGDKEIDEIPEEDTETRYYQNGRPTGFYAFNYLDKKVTGEDEDSVRNQLSEEYEMIPSNSMFISGILYPIQEEEYGYYKGNENKKLYVYREKQTETPYTKLNGNKIYADAKPQSKEKYFYFPFFPSNTSSTETDITMRGHGDCEAEQVFKGDKYQWFPRQRGESTTEEFIEYNGGFFPIDSLDEYCIRVMGYANTDEGTVYVGYDGGHTVYMMNEIDQLEVNNNYEYVDGVVKKKINYETTIYDMSSVSGSAVSKLYGLRSDNLLTDDVGDVLPGKYDVSDKTNHQPPEGAELDLIYEVGNVSRIVPFSGAGDNYYFGDIITSMEFYYKGYDDNKYGVVTVDLENMQTSLSAITESTAAASEQIENFEVEPDIYCEIQYIIGATLSGETIKDDNDLDIGMSYTLANAENGYGNGVLYTEEVQFVKTEVQYKLSAGVDGQIPMTEDAVSAHTLCYPVVCYVLKQKESELDSGFGSKYTYPVANFKMEFPPYTGWKGYSDSLEIFPVFRQEYLLGNAVMQNVDVDIYIDRGINAAFEKHLKLGEVTSMEALEQYSNGYFKMMEN